MNRRCLQYFFYRDAFLDSPFIYSTEKKDHVYDFVSLNHRLSFLQPLNSFSRTAYMLHLEFRIGD